MARPIDEELVRLRMDNSDFVKKASESTSIFQKLKDAFSKGGKSSSTLDQSVKSAENLGKAVKGVDMGALGKAIDMVNSRFSVMGQIASNVLSNVTNRVTNAAMGITKGLTMTPMIDGFQEYELNMNSIQTMLSNVAGATLPQVNATLAELNEYADRTIYSFADMTRNMGYFTTAGIGLKDSASMIKGISNLAAVSGSSTQQASGAMYQLSQAAASGTIRLQDWNSVVNAGMGGQKFQNALVQSGIRLGTLTGEVDNFRESLADEWLTSDVLLDTLTLFSEDEAMIEAATKIRTFTQLIDTMQEALGSGWGKTFELLLGDFEQSGEFFSRIGELFTGVIDDISDKRNNLVKSFVDMGGRDVLIDGIFTGLEAIGKALSVIGDAWSRVFPPATAQTLYNMAEGFRSLMSSLVMNNGEMERLTTIFQGFFSAISAGITIIKEVGMALLQLIPPNLINNILDFLAHIAQVPIELDKSMKSGEGIIKVIRSIGEIFGVVGRVIGVFVDHAIAAFLKMDLSLASIGRGILTLAVNIINVLLTIGQSIKNTISNLASNLGLDRIFDSIKNAFASTSGITQPIVNAFKSIGSAISSFVSDLMSSGSSITSFFSGLWDSIGGFVGLVQGAMTAVSTVIGGMASAIRLAASGIQSAFSIIGKVIGTVFSGIDGADILGAGLIGGIVVLVKNVGKLVDVFDSVKDAALDFVTSIGDAPRKVLDSLTGGLTGLLDNVPDTSLLQLAISIGVLAASLKVLEGMSYESIAKGLTSIGIGLSALMATSKILGGMTLTGGAGGILAMALSMSIIAKAMKSLSEVDIASMFASAASLSLLAVALGALGQSLRYVVIKPSTAISIMAIAASMRVLSGAVKSLGSMSMGELAKGLVSVSIGLAGLSAAALILSSFKMNVSNIAGLMALATAINMLVIPLAIIGLMPIGNIIKGLGSMAAMLLALSAAAMALSTMGSVALAASSLVIMAAAINMLVLPITILGALSLGHLAKGLVTVAAGLGVMVAALAIGAGISPGALLMASAMVVLAGAINMLVGPITILGSMPWQNVAQGIIALAGGLALIGGVAALIGMAAVQLLAFSASMMGLGVAAAVAGVGAIAFALAASILVEAVVAAAEALPRLSQAFGALLDAIAANIGKMANVIVEFFKNLVVAILGSAEAITSAVIEIVVRFAETLAEQAPRLVEASLELITGILKGIEQGLPQVIEAAVGVAVAFIDGFARGIAENAENIVGAVKRVIQAVGAVLIEFLASIFDSLDLPMGWGEKIAAQLREANQGIIAAASEGSSDVTEAYESNLESGADSIKDTASKIPESAAQGIESGTPAVESAGIGIRSAVEKIFDNLGLGDKMSSETDSIVSTLKGTAPKAGAATDSIGESILSSLDKFDLQKLMNDMGMKGADGLEDGLGTFDSTSFLDGLKGMVDPSLIADLEEAIKLDPENAYYNGNEYGTATAEGVSDGAGQIDLSSIPEAFDAVIPEVDASAGNIIAAFKDGLSQAEFEALGSSWGYDFSRGIWSAVGSDGRQHVTDAGVEMMYQLEQAIIGSGSLEAIGELVGIDLSGGITQNGGQYMTQAGVDLLMALEAGLSTEQLIAISELLGFDIASAIGTSGSAEGVTSGTKITDAVKSGIQNGNLAEAAIGLVSEFTGGFPLAEFSSTGTAAGHELQAGIDGVQITFGTLLGALGGGGGLGGMVSAMLLALGQGKLIGGNIQTGIESTDVSGTGTRIMQGVTDEAVTESSNTGTQVAAATETSLNTELGGIDLSSSATQIMDTFTTSITGQTSTATSAGKTIAEAVKSGIESVSLQASGTKLGTQFVTGVKNTEANARAAGVTIANSSRSGTESVSLRESGTKRGTQFVDGVKSTEAAARSAGTTIANAARDGAGSVSLHTTGYNMAIGMANGIYAGASSVYAAASNIAANARNIINNSLRMRSPSRVMAESGLWFSQGFAMGISNGEDEVERSAKDVALAARDAVSTLASAINDTLNEEVEFSPTITPVLDDSNLSSFTGIQNGFQKVVRMVDYAGFEDTDGRLLAKLRLENSRGAFSENDSKVININNERLLDGATFIVREEADINKIVTEVDTHMRREAELELLFNVGKGG